MELPRQDEKLFRAGTDRQFNACINCYDRSLASVASSYMEGAQALARATVEGDALLDLAILPIVYLYRQYLELVIKDIIDTARRLEGEGEAYPKHHNLRKLWTEAERLIRKHYGQQAPEELDHVQPCIDEFDEHDPESFSFRYPTDKKGNASLRDITHINVRNLNETMNRLSSFLDGIALDLGQKLEWTYEMQREYEP